MAANIIPALGRDFADSPLFDFAADLARSHAALLRDDPARVAPRITMSARPLRI